MKKSKFLVLLHVFSCCIVTVSFAQKDIVVSGGNATGSNGSSSYSVGQVVYTTNNGTTGTVTQGVQQPYEISEVLTAKDFSQLIKDVKVFPNPTTEVLTLSFINQNNIELDYQMFDLNGRVIMSQKNISNETTITVSSFPSAIYFLKITNKDKEVKTFKIIKK